MRLLLPVSEFLGLVRKEQKRRGDYQVKCFENTPLKEVIKRLVHEHVHRVSSYLALYRLSLKIFVVDNTNRAIGVISMTDIIKDVFP